MKKLFSLLAFVIITTINAQAPQGFNYQATVRNTSGQLLLNQSVSFKFSILQNSASGTEVYSENQTATTDDLGHVYLVIGQGTVTAGTFSTINWGAGSYYLGIELNTGSGFVAMGTTQLMSVPYALFSANGTPGPAGAMGPQGPIGPAGAAGQGGVTTAGADIAISGTGTIANPYVISSITFTIGLWPELGGYVFWFSADGKHGLVAETQDQGIGAWYEAKNLISNPSNHSVNGQKFRDWRMPTKYELNEMYVQRAAIGGFGNNFYWSSTEADSFNAWSQIISLGYQDNTQKSNPSNYVRAVRAF